MSVLVQQVTKAYGQIAVLRGLDLHVQDGELAALFGASGSGKTTLLNIIGALDTPSSGSVSVNGEVITAMTERQRIRFRRDRMGFIFQNHALIPTYTAAENIDLALRLRRLGASERRRRIHYALETVGLGAWAAHLPDELSGGQRQRIAIARTLAAQPQLVLADEPTSGLDTQTARRVLKRFRELADTHRTTFLIVSHDSALTVLVDSVYDLRDGLLLRR